MRMRRAGCLASLMPPNAWIDILARLRQFTRKQTDYTPSQISVLILCLCWIPSAIVLLLCVELNIFGGCSPKPTKMATSGSGGGSTLRIVADCKAWIQNQPHKSTDSVYIMLSSDSLVDGKVGTGLCAQLRNFWIGSPTLQVALKVYAGQFEPYKPETDIHIIVYINATDPNRLVRLNMCLQGSMKSHRFSQSLTVPDFDSALTEDSVAFCFVNEARSVEELLAFIASKYSEKHRLQQLEACVDIGGELWDVHETHSLSLLCPESYRRIRWR